MKLGAQVMRNVFDLEGRLRGQSPTLLLIGFEAVDLELIAECRPLLIDAAASANVEYDHWISLKYPQFFDEISRHRRFEIDGYAAHVHVLGDQGGEADLLTEGPSSRHQRAYVKVLSRRDHSLDPDPTTIRQHYDKSLVPMNSAIFPVT